MTSDTNVLVQRQREGEGALTVSLLCNSPLSNLSANGRMDEWTEGEKDALLPFSVRLSVLHFDLCLRETKKKKKNNNNNFAVSRPRFARGKMQREGEGALTGSLLCDSPLSPLSAIGRTDERTDGKRERCASSFLCSSVRPSVPSFFSTRV